MKIYISGICGTGMGPLALMAKDAGMMVLGSDMNKGEIFPELMAAGIEVAVGKQDGEFLKSRLDGLDWFVHTSALDENHPELLIAKAAGVKISKRDDLTAFLIQQLGLKLVAVSGTHGKTTTTAMIIFTMLKLGLPISYLAGTTLGFAPSGAYKPESRYFIYEADEYDRNFLKFWPWLAVLPSVSYDHADIYPTKEDYVAAFSQFKSQSAEVLESVAIDGGITLSGAVRKKDASLAKQAVLKIIQDMESESGGDVELDKKISQILNSFPGVGRRFEKISEGVYSDYAHHPEEIAATLEIAREEAKKEGLKGVVAVYQPHQNTRQHEVRAGYKRAFLGAEKVFWLPTYLTRENPELKVLSPEDLISELENPAVAEAAEMGEVLGEELKKYRDEGFLVILMTAGPAHQWFREVFHT